MRGRLAGWMQRAMVNLQWLFVQSRLLQDKAYLYAGGGIVADSEPQSEYEETLVKFRPMLRALGGQLHE